MGQRRLLKLGDKLRTAFDKLDEAFFGRGKEDVKLFDVRIETELLKLRGNPFGVSLVGLRPNMVRVGREFLHVSAQIVGAGNGAEFLFPLSFGVGRFGGVAEESLLVGDDMAVERRKREAREEKGSKDGATVHEFPLKWSQYSA